MTKILFIFFDSALILTISKKISYFVIQSSFLGMSSISNSEEQPPESPLDFLSRVATMVEKSQTSPATAAILQAPKSADPSTATNLTYTASNGTTDNNELSSTNSPPPSAENHPNSQNKSRFI